MWCGNGQVKGAPDWLLVKGDVQNEVAYWGIAETGPVSRNTPKVVSIGATAGHKGQKARRALKKQIIRRK